MSNPAPSKKAAKRQAIELLAAGTPIAEIARRTRCARSSIHRWINHDKNFAAAVAETAQAIMDASAPKISIVYERLMDAAVDAAAVLASIQKIPSKGLKPAIVHARVYAASVTITAARSFHQELRTAEAIRQLKRVDRAEEKDLRRKAKDFAYIPPAPGDL